MEGGGGEGERRKGKRRENRGGDQKVGDRVAKDKGKVVPEKMEDTPISSAGLFCLLLTTVSKDSLSVS